MSHRHMRPQITSRKTPQVLLPCGFLALCAARSVSLPRPHKSLRHASFLLRILTAPSLPNPRVASKNRLRSRSAPPAALAAELNYRQSSIVNRQCLGSSMTWIVNVLFFCRFLWDECSCLHIGEHIFLDVEETGYLCQNGEVDLLLTYGKRQGFQKNIYADLIAVSEAIDERAFG